jgi:hypothetical protein
MKVPQNECHIVKASSSQNSTMDHVLPSYYVLSLEWLMNFISCNKHKDDSFKILVHKLMSLRFLEKKSFSPNHDDCTMVK